MAILTPTLSGTVTLWENTRGKTRENKEKQGTRSKTKSRRAQDTQSEVQKKKYPGWQLNRNAKPKSNNGKTLGKKGK